MLPDQALHSWNMTPREAIALQKELRARLVLEDQSGTIRTIAGCDMAIDERTNSGIGGIILYTFPGMKEIERRYVLGRLEFPYVPGLLSFREAPVLLELFRGLTYEPDLIIFDGQGIAHPRGVGIASHMGLWLNKPTIGCAKSRLYGSFAEPGEKRGSMSPLATDDGARIGTVLRTRDGCRPVFISPGHLVSVQSSVDVILKCLDGFRIPKPTREADKYVAEVKREKLS